MEDTMTTNYVQPGNNIKLPVTADAKAGDWDMVGDLAVVLASNADSDDEAVCSLTGVFNLEVKGADNSGDAAISAGAKIYADGADLNADDADGTFFGHALEAVGSGATATVPVRLKQ
jgi:predicted RecA/RadA family phage recombinase